MQFALALIEVEAADVRQHERQLDVEADVPEHAEVGAQVEDVARLRELQVLDELGPGAVDDCGSRLTNALLTSCSQRRSG